MKQPVEVIISGIKCDAPGCSYVGYIDPAAVAENYASYINRPCPICGANLLTEADLALTKLLIAGANYANNIMGPVSDEQPYQYLRINMDGSGIPASISVKKDAGAP